MSDRGFWDDSLQALQQKYWESWSKINRKASGVDAASSTSPWEMAQEHWWQAVSPAAPDVTKEFMGRMMDQGRQYFRMAEMFAGTGREGERAPDWNQVLDRISAALATGIGPDGEQRPNEQLHRMMGFWEMPLDTWQRMASMLSILPGDLFRGVSPGGAENAGDRLFSVPGLGYSREEQAQLQQLMRLIRGYQRALADYSRFFSNIGTRSVERLRDRLAQGMAKGEVIDSARTLYDTWVSTCEAVYGEHVVSPDYARINGQLINASMAVKRHVGLMVDKKLGSLNMPTRSELRTMQARMQEGRRENRRLRTELEQLREQLSELRQAARPKRRTTAGARRKSTVRKKSSVKPDETG